MGQAVVDREDDEAAEVPPSATFGLRTAYLVVLGLALGGLLWDASEPTSGFLLTLACVLVVLLAGAVWLGAVVVVVVRLVRRKTVPRSGWLFVAVAMVLLAGAADEADAPLKVRFRLSEDAFDDVAARAEPGLPRTEQRDLGGVGRVGLYRPGPVSQQGEAVFVPTRGEARFGAGFVLLPDGPFPEITTYGRTFRHLRGDWYTWTDYLS